MANNQGTSGGAVFAAFIIGALAGAAAALLWAPASGEETRRALGERTREGRQRATEAARQGREFLNRQREHLADAVDRGRDAYEKARGEKESV